METNYTIPYIEGDGIGVDIGPPTRRFMDAAVAKAYGTDHRLTWLEVLAGEKALQETGAYLPKETLEILGERPVGGGGGASLYRQ